MRREESYQPGRALRCNNPRLSCCCRSTGQAGSSWSGRLWQRSSRDQVDSSEERRRKSSHQICRREEDERWPLGEGLSLHRLIWKINLSVKTVPPTFLYQAFYCYIAPMKDAKYCDQHLYVCPFAYLKNNMSNLNQIFLHVARGLFWRKFNMLFASVLEYVMFSYNWPGKYDINGTYSQSDSVGQHRGQSLICMIALYS